MPTPTSFFSATFCASPKSSHKQAFSPTVPFSMGSFRTSNPLTPNGRPPTPPYNFPGRATKEEAKEAILKSVQKYQMDTVENTNFLEDSEVELFKKEESPQERKLLAEKLRLFVSSNLSLDTSLEHTPA